MGYFTESRDVFLTSYLDELKTQIAKHPLLAKNNLTSDFVGARGFSVVFRRASLPQVVQRFPWLESYVETMLNADCNAFYLNPLELRANSRVDPHIDRSLRSYCHNVDVPLLVSVLYVALPRNMSGGKLVLRDKNHEVGRITPEVNKVVRFQGDLTHFVTPVGADAHGERLSVVCEQYMLSDEALTRIPELGLESRGKRY